LEFDGMAKNTVKQATTVRLDPEVKDRLNKLSILTDQSINDLTNEALRDFIESRSLKLEKELEATLENVRAVRKSDPSFKRGIAAFVKAEAALEHDPVEGKVITKLTPAQKKALGMPDE
jgi:predicted transcriptional regulator